MLDEQLRVFLRVLRASVVSSSSHERGRAGFTVVEMVIAVLIIGIMAAVAVPRYSNSLMRYRADVAARRIAGDLATARARARATSSSQAIVFTVPPAGNRYEINGMKDPNGFLTTYTVDLAKAPYVAMLSSVSLGGDTSLIYNGYGMPDSGGTIVVQAGQYTKTITIDQNTGMATIP